VWLKIFQVSELQQFKWREISSFPNEFLVKGRDDFSSTFPFSRKIVTFFSHFWDVLQHADKDKRELMFHKKVGSTKLNAVLCDAESKCTQDVLKTFIHDLLHLQHGSEIKNEREMQLIENVIFEIFTAKQTAQEHSSGNVSNLIACVFMLYKSISQELKQTTKMLELLPFIATDENINKWNEEQKAKRECVLHLSMFRSVLDHVKNQSDQMKGAGDCEQWRELFSDLRPTAEEILRNPCAGQLRKEWKALEFSDLFLSQLVPHGLSAKLRDLYFEQIIPLSKRLWKGAVRTGLESDKFLKIVLKILAGCSNDIRLRHLLNWKDLACTLCKKSRVVDPVILPCGHYTCLSCIELTLMGGVRQCPLCRATLPDDFDIKPSSLSEEQASDVATFTANCTSFFLEYLSTLCFPAADTDTSNVAIDENIVDALHELVIVGKSTRNISPLGTSPIDDTPTVRSFILQLLLRFSQEKIEASLESHFKQVEYVLQSRCELMTVYIRCIEDSLQNEVVSDKDVSALLHEQVIPSLEQHSESQITHLNLAAKLRFVVSCLSEYAYSYVTNKEQEHQDLLEEIIPEIQNIEVCMSYFVKIFCRRYGLNYFSSLLQDEHLKALVPSHLQPSNGTVQDVVISDTLIASGEIYSTSLNILRKVDTDEVVSDAVDQLSTLAKKSKDCCAQALLAAASHSCSSESVTSVAVFESLSQRICTDVESDIALDTLKLVKTDEFLASESVYFKRILTNLVMDVSFTIITSSGHLLNELNVMMSNPTLFDDRFLPTMPQSIYFESEVRQVISQWKEKHSHGPPKEYLCPKGHLYYIGDCTNPAKVDARCPECKEKIGGFAEGKLQPGNAPGKLEESSQAGYKLKLIEAGRCYAIPERQCNKASVCILQFLLHASMAVSWMKGVAIHRYIQLLYGSCL